MTNDRTGRTVQATALVHEVWLRLVRNEALGQRAAEDGDAVRWMEVRFLTGLGHQEAAQLMGITRRKADGLWAYARAWLLEAMRKTLGADEAPNSP